MPCAARRRTLHVPPPPWKRGPAHAPPSPFLPSPAAIAGLLSGALPTTHHPSLSLPLPPSTPAPSPPPHTHTHTAHPTQLESQRPHSHAPSCLSCSASTQFGFCPPPLLFFVLLFFWFPRVCSTSAPSPVRVPRFDAPSNSLHRLRPLLCFVSVAVSLSSLLSPSTFHLLRFVLLVRVPLEWRPASPLCTRPTHSALR